MSSTKSNKWTVASVSHRKESSLATLVRYDADRVVSAKTVRLDQDSLHQDTSIYFRESVEPGTRLVQRGQRYEIVPERHHEDSLLQIYEGIRHQQGIVTASGIFALGALLLSLSFYGASKQQKAYDAAKTQLEMCLQDKE